MNSPASEPLSDALARLYKRNLHVIKLGLDPMKGLLEQLDQPHEAFLPIHVAGTNGKGTVVAMISSILAQTGLKVGMYTSPHLVRFNERIQINGEPISDADLERMMDRVEQAATRLTATGERDVTFFEFTTALAFAWFADQGVHAAVIETGMGGRLDATNVVTPAVSVITGVGLDHMQYLGPDLAAIAREKAGIIKSGRPVICGQLPFEAVPVIEEVARSRSAPLIIATDRVMVQRVKQTSMGQTVNLSTEDGESGRATLSFLGQHYLQNAAVAACAALHLRDELGLPLSFQDVLDGVSKARWPARSQLLSLDPPVLLDGAHNPQAAGALTKALHEVWPRHPIGLVTGFVSDKDPAGFVKYFKSSLQACWIVPLKTERAMETDEVQAQLAGIGISAEAFELKAALLQAMHWAEEERGIVVIAGSLYLAGEVLELMETSSEVKLRADILADPS